MIKENLYTPNCIRTFSGIYMNVFEPTTEMLNVEDIAHALSNQCRFSGHLPNFYSVAQHSVLCSELVEDEHKLAALLHDASEAYMVDVPTPIKAKLSGYKPLEASLMSKIADMFGFEFPFNPKIKEADEFMLEWEWDRLMLKKEKYPFIDCWSPGYAKARFLSEFHKLTS